MERFSRKPKKITHLHQHALISTQAPEQLLQYILKRPSENEIYLYLERVTVK